MKADEKRLQNRVAVVTGSSRGIGSAVARAFAAHGAMLALVARDEGNLEAIKRDLEEETEVLAVPGDISREKDVARFVEAVMKRFGKIDVLVNNAGILTPQALIHEVQTEDWDRTLAVNLRGMFLMIKHVLPVMLERKSGVIINVSSGAGKHGAPGWGPYSASKFGVEALTQVLAAETRSQGIRTNAVNPGGVRTSMRAMAYPEENLLSLPHPDEVAPLFVYLASSEGRGMTGQSFEFREWIRAHPMWKIPAGRPH